MTNFQKHLLFSLNNILPKYFDYASTTYLFVAMRPQVAIAKLATYSGHTDCIYTVCAGMDPNEFYTAGGDGMIVKWNLTLPDQGTLVTKVDNSVYAMCLVREKNLLLIAENLKGIRLLDLAQNKELVNIPLPESTFFDLACHGNLLIIATHSGQVLLYDLVLLKLVHTLEYSIKSARCIALSTTRQEFAIGYSDGHIRIFDLGEFDLKNTIAASDNSIFTLSYDQSHQYLLSAGRDAHIKHWDVNAQYKLVNDIPAHLFAINHIQFRQDFAYFASCSMDKSIKVWDAQQMSLLKVIDKSRHAGHGTSINKLLWLQDALVSVSDDRKASVWKVDISPSA